MVETVELSTRRLLLERDSELAAILTVIENAREGAGQLVVIERNAGIGKTRLLHEARASAGKEGFTVLSARGGQLEDEFSFGIVRQLFEPLLAATAREERAELFAGAAALALPLFDEERLASGEQAIDAPYAMLHGLYWLAANLALRSPAMIAVDDLHWADAPSLRWIAYLAARLEGLPLLVVSAARPPEQSAQPELQSQLVADPATVVVRPQPLGEDAVAALVRALAGTEPDASFVSACRTATGGNPLFLRATLETLARDRVAPTAAGSDRVLRIGSKAVSRAVERGLTRLPSETVSFLRAAAVLGDGAPLHQVAALAELNVPTAARAASMLVCAGLLRQEDPVEFFHPVVRTGVYDDIDASGRTSAHRKAGELLLAAGAPPEQAAPTSC